MQRKARPRSGSPRIIVAFCTTLTIFGTTGCITTRTVVVGYGYTVAVTTAGTTIGTGGRISAGIVGGTDSTLSSRRAGG